MPLSLKVAVITHPVSNLLICLALILKNVFKRNIKSLWYDPHTPESWSDEFLLMLLNCWRFDGYCMWHKLLSSTKFSKFYIKHFKKITKFRKLNTKHNSAMLIQQWTSLKDCYIATRVLEYLLFRIGLIQQK